MRAAFNDNRTEQDRDSALRRALQEEWNRSGGPKYPHEKVVQFCFRNYPPDVRARIQVLDMGCGSGVHTVFLASEGFQVTGIDISPTGIANTRRKLERANLSAALRVESIETLDFPPDSFDLILCVGVFECVGFAMASQAARRAADILRDGGCGLFLFAGDRDFRFLSDPPQVLHGFSREEVEAMFAHGFRQVWTDRYMTTYRGGECEQNDWLITARK